MLDEFMRKKIEKILKEENINIRNYRGFNRLSGLIAQRLRFNKNEIRLILKECKKKKTL